MNEREPPDVPQRLGYPAVVMVDHNECAVDAVGRYFLASPEWFTRPVVDGDHVLMVDDEMVSWGHVDGYVLGLDGVFRMSKLRETPHGISYRHDPPTLTRQEGS